MGIRYAYALARPLAAALVIGGLAGPLHDAALGVTGVPAAAPAAVAVRAEPALDRAAAPAPRGFSDDAARVAFDPPVGWVRTPESALDPLSDPPDPAHELARFQLRIGDPSLYAVPVPLTGALVRDAGAVITLGVAREGGELLDLDVDPRADREEASSSAGFVLVDDERTYEGLHVLTRYVIARATDHRLVLRAVTSEDEWAALAPMVRASFDTLRADPDGPNAPPAPAIVAAPVPPPPPAPVEAQPVDPSLAIRQTILDRAAALLATPYVWGGNVAGRGMDCSAYVSAAWGVARYTTESIGWVSAPIAKSELRPGDAMNLTIGRDPEGYGHIRLFEAWANEAHTLVWVYEETPPRAVHRVVVYDERYQPIRLAGLSGAGLAPLVPAPAPAPEPRLVPAQPRTAPTARPARTATPRPTPRPTVAPFPIITPRPVVTPRPVTTVRPTPRPTRTPLPTPTVRR